MNPRRQNRTKPSPNLRNPKCYAQAVGGCCIEINLEHYVSEGIIELVRERFGEVSRTVAVQNLTFQPPDTLEEKGIGYLAARILCVEHNGRLTHLDEEGKSMFVATDAFNEKSLNAERPPVSIQIDGDKLERWILKTLYGGLYSGNFPLAAGLSFKRADPPEFGLHVLFRDEPFAPGLGLHYVYRRPGEMISADSLILKFKPLVAEARVVGLSVWFFGLEFLLLSEGLEADPGGFEAVAYRPSGLQDLKSGARIGFTWKSGPESGDVEVMGQGRADGS